MQRDDLQFGLGFRVSIGNGRAQAAEMAIPPGGSEGGPDNDHAGADQWLFVVSGTGEAIVDGKHHPLQAGSLVLIERGERHEIRCTGKTALETMSVYVPPAYTKAGDELPPGKSSR